jgi:hypothetical protein
LAPAFTGWRFFLFEDKTVEQFSIPKHQALAAVADEPEMPGEMPPALWDRLRVYAFENNKAATAEVMRAYVRVTKRNIYRRIGKVPHGY